WAFTRTERFIRPVEDAIDSAHGREIGISPVDLRRLLSAVDRFYDAIFKLGGVSEATDSIRADAWNACFGRSLDTTLDFERTINDLNVLILGEPGTGKEIVARAIQEGHLGPPDGSTPPCLALNGAAIPEHLAESELFGHKKGAFTGATDDAKGLVRESDHGALFIDEVADISEAVQPKLLRVMETNRVSPVGSNRVIEVDVRYVSATSKPIREMAKEARFRVDLYDRLRGTQIRIPPLRERREDIEPIARSIVRRRFEARGVRPDPHAEEEVVGWLRTERASYHWPGNVRELHNEIGKWEIGLPSIEQSAPPPPSDSEGSLPPQIARCTATVEDVTLWYIERVLDSVGENRTHAERILGMSRSTIRRRLKAAGRKRLV
ncbi:MAG: sigma-54-dependent Fis family transcriptional regulator, partial [Acidobacteria bacterium]|nr:sigma-54-dependent Fis family transcriptional regulator [Acidobacteriota bacterium]